MIPLKFDRDRVAELLHALDTGEPLESKRTLYDHLMLAGACWFAVISRGPQAFRDGRFDAMPAEHREASQEVFMKDVEAAIAFCAQQAQNVWDDEYELPPSFTALITTREDDPPLVSIITPDAT